MEIAKAAEILESMLESPGRIEGGKFLFDLDGIEAGIHPLEDGLRLVARARDDELPTAVPDDDVKAMLRSIERALPGVACTLHERQGKVVLCSMTILLPGDEVELRRVFPKKLVILRTALMKFIVGLYFLSGE